MLLVSCGSALVVAPQSDLLRQSGEPGCNLRSLINDSIDSAADGRMGRPSLALTEVTVASNIPPAFDGEVLRSEDHALLARPVPALLGTVNPSGTPQQTVMWYSFQEGHFLFVTRSDRAKYRNLLRDPRASVVVVDPDNMYRWVIATGKLSVDEREAEPFYRNLASRYLSGNRLEAWQKVANFDLLMVIRLMPDRIMTKYKSTFD